MFFAFLLLLFRNCIFSHLHSFDVKDPLNETAEGPSLWAVTSLNGQRQLDRIDGKLKGSRGKEGVEGDSDGAASLKINLTVVNSTFNYTTTQEVSTSHNKVRQL